MQAAGTACGTLSALYAGIRPIGEPPMSNEAEQPSRRELPPAVQVKFRCREDLKSKIDAAAVENEVSLSAEINRRLIATFDEEQRSFIETALMGGNHSAAIVRGISALITVSGAGKDNYQLPHYRAALRHAIEKLLSVMLPGIIPGENVDERANDFNLELVGLFAVVDMYLKRVMVSPPYDPNDTLSK